VSSFTLGVRFLVVPPRGIIRLPTRKRDKTFLKYSNKEEFEIKGEDGRLLKVVDDCDWLEAELTLMTLPQRPSPDLTAEEVARCVTRSLQLVDYPNENDGLKRCYDFFGWMGRKVVTGRHCSDDTEENFVEHGLYCPAIRPFMGASRIGLGEPTLIKGTRTRGDIVSFPLTITCASIYQFQHFSGKLKDGISTDPPTVHMVMRLERKRGPPDHGCFLVRELLEVRYALAGDTGNFEVGG